MSAGAPSRSGSHQSRSASRRVAVEVLYAADVRDAPASTLLVDREDVSEYARHLVTGVEERREEIDALLAANSANWSPARMSAVDRNVLRVAVLEFLDGSVPSAVVIDEAVELAKTFSGDGAGRFVNGVLAGIIRTR